MFGFGTCKNKKTFFFVGFGTYKKTTLKGVFVFVGFAGCLVLGLVKKKTLRGVLVFVGFAGCLVLGLVKKNIGRC